MCPADPYLRTAEEEGEPSTFGDEAIDALVVARDTEGLLALAKAYRAGDGVARDLKKCLLAYQAATQLGSGEASYAVALFHLRGVVVAQDLATGAAHLREAADRGNVSARVHLGNFYELGIHYKADSAKADVWYRSAARAAEIDEEPDSPGWERALAELGAGRFVQSEIARGAVDDDERRTLLARAKAHGFRVPSQEAPANATHEPKPAAHEGPATIAEADEPQRPAARKVMKPRASNGWSAFGFALLFIAGGAAAAYVATLGAAEWLARGNALPVFGRRSTYVFPSVFLVLGVLPTALAYRAATVVKAIGIGVATGLIGFVAWGTGRLVLSAARDVQALAFGAAGFLAALLVLGLLGGTKPTLRRR